jgi:hypothetical protein
LLVDLNWSGGGVIAPPQVDTQTPTQITRTYTISGYTAAPGPFTIHYYISQSPVFGQDVLVPVGNETISAAADLTLGSHTANFQVLIDMPGTFYFYAQLDSTGSFREFNPNNDVAEAGNSVVATGPLFIINGQPGYTDAGGWTTVSGGYNGTSRQHTAGDGTAAAMWVATGLTPQSYNVEVTWVPGASNATNVLYSVWDGTTLLGQQTISQQVAPVVDSPLTITNGDTINGTIFQSLGLFTTISGTLTVVVTDAGNGIVNADTVRIYAQAAPTAQSPTGRNPTLLWTPQQQAVWERMEAENHPWWQLIQQTANATGTNNQAYGDIGNWATLAYQITGNSTYAAKAWGVISTGSLTSPPTSANETRAYFELYVIMYDWLYPALTAAQRQQYIGWLNAWADWTLGINTPPYVGGFSVAHVDYTIGDYFGLAFIDLATGPDNPLAGTFLNQTAQQPYIVPIGGLDATGTDRTTVRNALNQWISTYANGGQFISSSMYDLETLVLYAMGVDGVATASGQDHFPEADQFIPEAALNQIYNVTSDLQAAYKWGDEQDPRAYQSILYNYITVYGLLAGMTQNDPQVGPYINQLVDNLTAKYGYSGYDSAEPWQTMFFLYNPYANHADWSNVLPQGHYSPGMGFEYFHDSWAKNSSLFGAHMSTRISLDHEVNYFGDFQLYRNGEWAATHPIGYGGPAAANNTMLIAGLPSMYQRGPVAQEFGPNGSYAYIAGTTSGQYYAPGYYNPPPTFLNEWTRSLFYLPSSDGHSDTIIVFDRVNALNPQQLPNFSQYAAADQTAIENAPALKQWIIHAPVNPTITSSGVSWQTAGGQQINVSTLLPLNQTRTVYNETQLWGNSGEFSASELHYEIAIAPSTPEQWDTFLNVVQASDSGTTLTNTLEQSTGGEVQGVLVQRGGLSDVLVMFGAEQSARILSAGYTVNWTGGTSQTQVYLPDLDTSKTWTVTVDGGAATTLNVSGAGIGALTVSGTGAHTITLAAS